MPIEADPEEESDTVTAAALSMRPLRFFAYFRDGICRAFCGSARQGLQNGADCASIT